MKNFFIIAPAILLAVLLAFLYYTYDPQTHHFPRCPTYQYLHFYCPGCGAQRAVHQVLHLHFAEAVKANALLVFSIPYLITGFAFENKQLRNRYAALRQKLFGQAAIYIILAVLISYTILRNILQ